MKKLILKTAAVTLFAALLTGTLVLLILSFAAPAFMMDFTASLGMESASGNFAYEEYQRSGDLGCLARSFLIAQKHGDDKTALVRWDALYGEAGFSAYCEENEPDLDGIPAYRYRDYLTGSAAKAMYRLSHTDEEKEAALAFAAAETLPAFPAGNPMVALASEALIKEDAPFLERILGVLRSSAFERNKDFLKLTELLEESVK